MKKKLLKNLALSLAGGLLSEWFLYGGRAIPALAAACGSESAAVALQVLAFVVWWASILVGSLLWDWEKGSFLLHSLLYYLLVCGGFFLYTWTLKGWPLRWDEAGFLLGIGTAVYVCFWLSRYLAYRRDVELIRKKLGLEQRRPSRFLWRETLPHVLLTAVLYLGLPPLLDLVDAIDVPILTALLLPYAVFPFIALRMGYGIGRQYGFCPYPLEAGLLFLPNLLAPASAYGWWQPILYAVLAFAGMLAGVLRQCGGEKEAENGPPGGK